MPDSQQINRVSRTNPDFWRAHKSRVEVRSILLDFSAACPKEPPPPAQHRALWALHEKLDWGALKAMVNAKQ
jgi:hypothetical protein